MQLTTTTKVVTTKTHAGAFSADEVLAAIKVMARQTAKDTGLPDEQIDSVSVKAMGDGSYTVEIVEKATEVAPSAPTTSAVQVLHFGSTGSV